MTDSETLPVPGDQVRFGPLRGLVTSKDVGASQVAVVWINSVLAPETVDARSLTVVPWPRK